MSASPLQLDGELSLFDRIAKLIPAELRERYYRRMAHLRRLSEDDEILQICEAMGFLALLIRDAPERVAQERVELERLFTREQQPGVDLDLDILASRIVEKMKTSREIPETLTDQESFDALSSAAAVYARQIQEAGERAVRMANEFAHRLRWSLATMLSLCFLSGAVIGAAAVWMMLQG